MTWSGCNVWCERTDGFTCGEDYCDIEIGLIPEPATVMSDERQSQLAAEIMDRRFGPGWRDLPMLRSPEWAAAWREAGEQLAASKDLAGGTE